MRVGELIEKYDRFDPLAVAEEAFAATSDEYADINAEQMFSGRDSKGMPITLDGRPGYARKTYVIKKAKGQPTDRITLRDTGNFQRKLYAKMKGKYINTGSTDSKALSIEERTGKEIFGLDEGNSKRFSTGNFLRKYLALAKSKL